MANTSLFIYESDQVIMYILVYVDDILLTGNNITLIETLISQLNNQFALKDLEPLHFFLGLEVTRNNNGLPLCQTMYAKDLFHKANMQESKPSTTSFATDSKLFPEDSESFDQPLLYCNLIKELQCLTLTRLDISYFVNKLNQFLQNAIQL